MHSASGPGEELSCTRRPPAAQDGCFAWETVFEESCCHASGFLQILRLDCRKQGRRLGQESKRCSRDQKYLFSFNAQSYLCAPEACITVFAHRWTITAFISCSISGIIPSEMTLDLMFLKLDAHSMNWPRHVMSHGKLQLFPNFFLASTLTVSTRLSRGTQLVWVMLWKYEPRTWRVHMEEQRGTLELPPWPDPLAFFIKQLVLLRWEQPPESLAGFRFLFLSPHPKVLRHLDVWPPWGLNLTRVRQTWNQKLNWTSWRVKIPPPLIVFSVTVHSRAKTQAN